MFDKSYLDDLPPNKKFDLATLGAPGYILTHCRKVWSDRTKKFLYPDKGGHVKIRTARDTISRHHRLNILAAWRWRWSDNHIRRISSEDQCNLSIIGLPKYIITRDKRVWSITMRWWVKISPAGKVVVSIHNKSKAFKVDSIWNCAFGESILDVAEENKKSLSFLGFDNHIVTRTGKVWSVSHSMYMSQQTDKDGYQILVIRRDGEKVYVRVHRLVAQAFHPNPENKPEVNHLDGIKTNNNDWNLEWATKSENVQHAYDNGLTFHRDW